MSSNALRHPAKDLRFFRTVPHACSYLPGREATTLFLDPQEALASGVYDALTQLGFRRSGSHLYRPHCENCNACRSARIPVADFQPSRTQRKIARRNADIHMRLLPARFMARHYALYDAYIRARHADGEMYPPSREQYQAFLMADQPYAQLLEMTLDGRLVGVAAVDRLDHGLSAIYTFFDVDPRLDRRSLGTFAILALVELAQRQGLPHVYLGYWIEQCRKMRYKQTFSPLEILDGRRWRKLMPF
ncbi:MAG: arginyltransferase [Halomonas subglaciescola]|nr:arginyltransferase [Halomonas subglaciescola]